MIKFFKSRGYTDKLYFLNLTLSWLFIIVCIVITIFSGKLGITDLSLVSVGMPAVFAELGIHTGFIVWKAKTENISKYGYPEGVEKYGVQPIEEDPEVPIQAIGFQVQNDPIEEETTDDNNVVHNNADVRSRDNSPLDGSDQESIHEFRERILGKRHRFN
jgi:hypothetical protein